MERGELPRDALSRGNLPQVNASGLQPQTKKVRCGPVCPHCGDVENNRKMRGKSTRIGVFAAHNVVEHQKGASTSTALTTICTATPTCRQTAQRADKLLKGFVGKRLTYQRLLLNMAGEKESEGSASRRGSRQRGFWSGRKREAFEKVMRGLLKLKRKV